MSLQNDLAALQKDMGAVQNKVSQAIRIRGAILQRISQACAVLKANPQDKSARRSLVINLERERRFLDIVRKGTKKGESILDITLVELKRIEAKPQDKSQMAQIIQFLIDAMRYARGKIKVIEKRIKKGERLEKRDYAGRYLNEFMETLKDEEKLDEELALNLEIGSRKYYSQFEALKLRFKLEHLPKAGLAWRRHCYISWSGNKIGWRFSGDKWGWSSTSCSYNHWICIWHFIFSV